jgi:hypothetical protein
MMTLRPALALALVSVASCTSATGQVEGGDPRLGYDASFPAPLVVPITEPTFADAPATSYRGLYRDFFGRRALSSCAGRTSCHADATGLGAKGSNFICADKDTCWDTMRHAIDATVPKQLSTVPLVADSDVAAPENAYLFRVIRLIDSQGMKHENFGMPKVPTDFYFKQADIDRMQTWIRNGALND